MLVKKKKAVQGYLFKVISMLIEVYLLTHLLCCPSCMHAYLLTHPNETVKSPDSMLTRQGLYHARISKWKSAFGNRFLVLLYDEFREDPLKAYEKVSPSCRSDF